MFKYMVFCTMLSCVTSRINLRLLNTAENTFQYLKEQNYTYENHTVVTQDGYRLLLVRIPYNRNESSSDISKPPILFVHGILCGFSDFLVAGPGKSIGFKAAEEGYDAFFLNTRGNRWSRNHTTLGPDRNANAFWNFSKLKTCADRSCFLTPAPLLEQSQVSYVVHSQGTTAFLALTSTRPYYNEKLKVAILLAPVSYLQNAKFLPLRLLKNIANFVQGLIEILHINEFLPYRAIVSNSLRVICSPKSPLLPACKILFYEAFGHSAQINDFIVSPYLTNYPVGCSAKQLLHFLQNAHSGKFRLYDYGKQSNLLEYSQTTPPDYNLSAIITPVALYYGTNDYYIASTDVAKLIVNLPNVIRNVVVGVVKTNHLDVLIGTLAERLVTQPVLNVLNEYNNL